jgi:hypothetical protein
MPLIIPTIFTTKKKEYDTNNVNIAKYFKEKNKLYL